MSKMNPVVHFEMPAKDNKRVADFYTKAFGWKMNQLLFYYLWRAFQSVQPGSFYSFHYSNISSIL
jgi:predicted enzyme related to lactoylglutathione lyase